MSGSMSSDTSPLCVAIFISPGLYRPLRTTPLTALLLYLSVPSAHLLLPSAPSFSLCLQSLEDLEEAKRKKKKEKMGLGSLSRVFARGKQRKSLDPGLFDGTSTPDYYIEEDADW